jgi:hypothetical protein
MGKKWDYDVPSVEIWQECLRVLKPGGYLLAFAGTRTQHRMAVRIEDAGFEIRDLVFWCYGQGFPKSLNIGKAVDKLQGNEREVIGKEKGAGTTGDNQVGNQTFVAKNQYEDGTHDITKGTSEWEGWGTATKPAVEPVSICAKPLPPSIIYAIMGIDLTNKIISLCQKSNANVNDVELILRSIQQLLEKAGVNTVHENARTLNWENIESVIIAAVNFISQKHTSKEQAGEIKEVSVQENANQNGKNNLLENSIQTGKAESLSEKMDTLLSILVTRNIDSNTISLWKSILEDTLKKANTFTTETALKTIIAWKIYNSLLSANTQNFTSPNKSISPALKPALEPITVARKPIEGTVAENCLKWGVGGINIEQSRVPNTTCKNKKQAGRFPANLILDGSDEVVELFPNSKSTGGRAGHTAAYSGGYKQEYYGDTDPGYNDSGSAARFFYCAKASKTERNMGCEGLEKKKADTRTPTAAGLWEQMSAPHNNFHPTVKPIALMEYLIKLVSREGHTVLDPFMGSGTTGIACKNLNRDFIGIEKDEEYVKIAEARIRATPTPLI